MVFGVPVGSRIPEGSLGLGLQYFLYSTYALGDWLNMHHVCIFELKPSLRHSLHRYVAPRP